MNASIATIVLPENPLDRVHGLTVFLYIQQLRRFDCRASEFIPYTGISPCPYKARRIYPSSFLLYPLHCDMDNAPQSSGNLSF
jgi:hypothetical protein